MCAGQRQDDLRQAGGVGVVAKAQDRGGRRYFRVEGMHDGTRSDQVSCDLRASFAQPEHRDHRRHRGITATESALNASMTLYR